MVFPYVQLYTVWYLADFLKANLTKFTVMQVKRSKGRFFAPKISRITISREKERRKRKSEEDERRRREKRNGCTLRFIMATLESFWPKKPV